MKKNMLLFLVLLPLLGFSQLGFHIGVKAGLNFSNITNASSIKASNRTGYLFGATIASGQKKLLGFRSEFILSRQGYDYKSNTNTGKVNLDYLLLPQVITLRFTRFVQLHVGLQAAFLLNAKVDSSGSNGNGSLFDYLKRFDYGIVGGGEISPIGGLYIGARFNTSFNNVNKDRPIGGNWPNFIPYIDSKNTVVQVYAGFRF